MGNHTTHRDVTPVCAFCSGKRPVAGLTDFGATHPLLALFWHPTRNGRRKLSTVSAGSAFEAWWRCPIGHEFKKAVHLFRRYPSCPNCRDPHRFRVLVDLREKYPSYSAQWDPERNATSVPPPLLLDGYDSVWWICPSGHPFSSTIENRRRRKWKCPACNSRRALSGFNDLGTTHKSIAAELHPTLNGKLRAETLLPQSQKRVWWLCPSGHEYPAVVAVRTKLGIGCTKCTGRSIIKGETDFATARPESAARWHPTLNGDITPSDVHPGSAQKACFTCPCGKPYWTEIRMMRVDRYCREYTDYLRWHSAVEDLEVSAAS
ncbi:zinc-ribbon domain-containing protein [Cryobacterium sp. RTC2.1]|uniref:zinc-ribbon domain-containing protein n=1 Tax=Cryobacterium sp. RTC2.1 TaxID=3048634 RepID=UPI003A599696